MRPAFFATSGSQPPDSSTAAAATSGVNTSSMPSSEPCNGQDHTYIIAVCSYSMLLAASVLQALGSSSIARGGKRIVADAPQQALHAHIADNNSHYIVLCSC